MLSYYFSRCGLRFILAALAALVLSASSSQADSGFIEKAQMKIKSAGGYQRLLDKINADGEVRIIIGLNCKFTPIGRLSDADAAAQLDDIATAQNKALDALSGHRVSNLTKYTYTPQMAMTVDKAALEVLINSDEVIAIWEDTPDEHTLDLSVPRIGAATVMNTYGYTGSGVYVAILDTGVDKTHPFLSGAVISEACYSSTGSGTGYTYESVCPGGVTESTATGSALPYAGSCPTGSCDHGTHVAGIAAGRHNGVFSGVAKGVGVIAIQIFTLFNDYPDCGGEGTKCVLASQSDQIKGLQRVYDLRNTYNIAAVNMSLGGGRYYSACDSDVRKPYIDNLRSVGIATIISSGNKSYKDSIAAPACVSTAISVGATTDADAVASYSNSASFLSLLAPGSSINSSIPGGSYSSWSGTSMAAPHVTGAWALLKQANPGSSVSEILSALQSTGLSVTDTNGITKPRIQVDSAFLSLPCNNPPVKKSGSTYYYPTIQSGYNALAAGQTALLRQMVFAEDLVLSGANAVRLIGGYDCGFSSVTGYSTLNGSLTITGAAVTVSNMIIMIIR